MLIEVLVEVLAETLPDTLDDVLAETLADELCDTDSEIDILSLTEADKLVELAELLVTQTDKLPNTSFIHH